MDCLVVWTDGLVFGAKIKSSLPPYIFLCVLVLIFGIYIGVRIHRSWVDNDIKKMNRQKKEAEDLKIEFFNKKARLEKENERILDAAIERETFELFLERDRLNKRAEEITNKALERIKNAERKAAEEIRLVIDSEDKRIEDHIKKHIDETLKKNKIQHISEAVVLQNVIASKKEVIRKAEEALSLTAENLQESAPFLTKLISELKDVVFFERSGLQKYITNWAPASYERFRDLRSRLKKESERALVAETKVEFYERIMPELTDVEVEPEHEIVEVENEDHDSIFKFVSKEDYFRLSEAKRGDLALSRYWNRRKSNREIGEAYERYIGHLYENKGYKVSFNGIENKLHDRGIDLICENNKEIVLIQCKNWSVYKTIFENVAFQFYGSVFFYRYEFKPQKNVRGIIYSTTDASDFVKKALPAIGIEFVLKPMDYGYPCIKCNIGKEGEGIYHLPFDQQYDRVVIEINRGEFYAKSCEEAEKRGFRRASRYYGFS